MAASPTVGHLADNAPHPPPGVSWTVTAPRHQAPEGYVAIDNALLFDNRLSLGARGLLFEMLSYPPGWTTTVAERTIAGRESRSEVLDLLVELETAGHVKQVHS